MGRVKAVASEHKTEVNEILEVSKILSVSLNISTVEAIDRAVSVVLLAKAGGENNV